MGEIRSAKVLRIGALLIFCRDSAQLGKAIRVNKIEEKRVKATIATGAGEHTSAYRRCEVSKRAEEV